MNPEERELLTQSIKLAEENNKMLRGIRRGARISSFLRVLYWIIILVLAFGSYYIIKPFIDPLVNSYNQIQGSLQNIKSVSTKLPTLPSWLGGKE